MLFFTHVYWCTCSVSELELEGGTVHVVQGICVSSNYCKKRRQMECAVRPSVWEVKRYYSLVKFLGLKALSLRFSCMRQWTVTATATGQTGLFLYHLHTSQLLFCPHELTIMADFEGSADFNAFANGNYKHHLCSTVIHSKTNSSHFPFMARQVRTLSPESPMTLWIAAALSIELYTAKEISYTLLGHKNNPMEEAIM